LSQLDDLTHRATGAFNACHVGSNPAGHLHGDEWITIDVRILSQREVFNTFANVRQTFAEFSASHCAHRRASEQAQAT